jgi:asparagine synthase (glutamine-hydrolysing)
MTTTNGRFAVTFNGEIYNYRSLRTNLEAKGYAFRSQSDTEVLLHLYAEKGEAMVHDIRGMFAFAIWDNEKANLFLARDPYGIKPLYYADDGRAIRFASSVKALLAGGQVSATLDLAGVMGFYLLGNVPEPFTTYRKINALAAGSSLTIDVRGPREVVQYTSLSRVYCEAEGIADELKGRDIQELFQDALLDSVRHHLVADVPVGAFLSAGVDSGALVGLMGDAGQGDVRTVTLAFEEYRGTHADEAPLAFLSSRHYGTRHTVRYVGAAEFHRDLPKILEAMDQPSVDGVNTWFVSKAAHEIGLKVAVSGVGGDELLGGYDTFQSIPARLNWLKLIPATRHLAKGFESIIGAARAMGLQIHPKSAGLLTYGTSYPSAYLLGRGLFLPTEVDGLLEDQTMVREGLDRLNVLSHLERVLTPAPRSSFGKVAVLESSMYLRNQLLRDTDWAGMAHSLEIRTPLVDHTLLQRVSPIMVKLNRPAGKTLIGRSPKRPLPDVILDRPKTGFGIPIKSWSKGLTQKSASGRTNADHRLWSRTWACEIFVRNTTAHHNRNMALERLSA